MLAAAHLRLGRLTIAQPELAVDNQAVSGRADGNTVQVETELLKLNQNMVENALGTQLVTYKLGMLRMAITGKD